MQLEVECLFELFSLADQPYSVPLRSQQCVAMDNINKLHELSN